MLSTLFWFSLSTGLAQASGEAVPQAVADHVRENSPGAEGIKRVPKKDVGAYQAFQIERVSVGPGDPGHFMLYAKDGKPMVKGVGDWSDFLGAAPPEQVAKALARPLDLVFHPSGPEVQNKYHPLHRLSEAVRKQVVDPRRLEDGSLEFFIQDRRGDPPSDVVYRVVVTAQASSGLKTTREPIRSPTK